MSDPFVPGLALAFPELGGLYAALGVWVELALRVFTGFALVPHGLQKWFGMFSGTRIPSNMPAMARKLAEDGYRPGLFWAVVIALTELIAGPMLGLGLFTRLAALPVTIFLFMAVLEHGRRDGYFWTERGLEYPLLWALSALYFLIHGGGPLSLDTLVLGVAI